MAVKNNYHKVDVFNVNIDQFIREDIFNDLFKFGKANDCTNIDFLLLY